LNDTARKEMQSSQQAGNVEEIFKQLEVEHSAARDCCRRLQRKYGNLKPEDMPPFKLKLKDKCSEYATKEDVLMEMLQY
jgi:hemerythrin-like domain-containing protein